MNLRSRTAIAYLTAFVLGPLAVMLIRLLGSPWGGRLLFAVLSTPVVVAAWLAGRRSGLFATLVVIAAYMAFNTDRLQTSRDWTNFSTSALIFFTTSFLLSWLISAFQSAQRQAEKELEARLNLAAIVESSDDAIVSEDLEGVVTSWNRGAEKLYGYSSEEAVGKPISFLVSPDRQDELRWIMERIRRGGRVEHLETQRVRKDGSCVDVSLVVSPIKKDADYTIGVSTIARDITASKEADRHKNEFLALLAHELRNPLAPLCNGLEVIKLAKNDVDVVESTRIMMERQLQQMTRLVDDLLDVSRISQGKLALRKEDVPLASIINTAVETCGPLIQQNNHELTITLPDQSLYVNADKARLSQVLSNLLNNAAKYTNRGGKIWLSAERDGMEAVIRVRDTGIGISPEMLPKIFDLFTQVDHSIEKSQSGLGVGLNIVRRIVEMHGGTVEAHSKGNGMGSEFAVRLPIVLPKKYERPEHTESQAHPAVGRRILVADDNRDAAYSLAAILKIMGHDVRTASDGLEAVTLAGEFLPEILFLDIGMPTLNGYEACRRIREQPWGQNIYVVALTGWGQEEDRARSKDAGFDAHLVKPLEPKNLQQLLA